MSFPLFAPLDFSVPRSISPTDIGAFGRLEGCERFLRLRLHTANGHADWLKGEGLQKQTIPPLLTTAGGDFEAIVERAIEADGGQRVHNMGLSLDANSASDGRLRADANERLLTATRELKAGERVTLSQPTLEVAIGDWLLRGVLDLLRLSRDENGDLSVLIADIKASQRAKVEHRLQLAFYYRMIESLFGENEIAFAKLEFGVLYRGPQSIDEAAPDDREKLELHSRAAREVWGMKAHYFERCDDQAIYLNSLDRLVFDEGSLARGIATRDFAEVPFHLSSKCDACVFSEFCLQDSARRGDLSLLPYLTATEKGALQKGGIADIGQLAALKAPREVLADQSDPQRWNELETDARYTGQIARLAGDRQVGGRLDELIHRAHAFQKSRGAQTHSKSYIPSKGEGTLPYVTSEVNANIVRIYLDGGLDYVNNRAYLLGARFVAYQDGQIVTSRNVTAMTPAPPHSADVEANLIREFFARSMEVAVEMAVVARYIDEATGEVQFRAPVHVTFFDGRSQKIWLETLGRHIPTVMQSAPIFDFLKQLPSGDSFVVSTLDSEARQLKNFPLLAPSLQKLSRYLGYDWGEFANWFRRGIFDDARTLEETDQWYTARSRFSSQIPLEYAYGAWNQLPAPQRRDDLFKGFRGLNPDQIELFCERRLEAIEHIGKAFRGNSKTSIAPYDLNCLNDFQVKEPTFVEALQTFLQLEKLADLGAWKAARHAPPERRMLAGDSLVVRYLDADQSAEVRAQNAKNRDVTAQQKAWREHTPTGRFPEEFNTKQLAYGFTARLRIETEGCDCCLQDAINLATLGAGEFAWLHERETYDSRLPESERVLFHPTVRQLLIFSKTATILEKPFIDENGNGWVEIKAEGPKGGDKNGFAFGSKPCILEDNTVYSLDATPNDWSGAGCFAHNEEIEEGAPNFVHDLLAGAPVQPYWTDAARTGQQRFLAGLKQLGKTVFEFEPSKESYIGEHGDAPMLLVQGPPGTGKTYATAFALLARIQGAMAANIAWRGLISTHTHAAVNVALKDVYDAQQKLREVRATEPQVFAEFFDERLLDVPLFRLQGTSTDWAANSHLTPLWSAKSEAEANNSAYTSASAALLGARWNIAGATPMGIKKVWKADKEQLPYFNALIVDEASQMNQPLACLASVANAHDSTLIVVGDPRQMPPITKHEWETESHRVFQGEPAFESFYAAIDARDPVKIQFEESFRLHARMAQFLGEAIYQQDGINYHSNKTKTLDAQPLADPFLAAVLAPEHPLVLIEHDEALSILENPAESAILRPLLEQLTGLYALDAHKGLGVVVPHRAQRALLADDKWKVDTVERYQGDQRQVMAFSATESDPIYLLNNGGFLLDPRRLCVSLSRAKEKLILVAAKSVFDLVPLDEETFLNAQLWQKLRHEFCTHELWQGEIGGAKVRVLGSGLG